MFLQDNAFLLTKNYNLCHFLEMETGSIFCILGSKSTSNLIQICHAHNEINFLDPKGRISKRFSTISIKKLRFTSHILVSLLVSGSLMRLRVGDYLTISGFFFSSTASLEVLSKIN